MLLIGVGRHDLKSTSGYSLFPKLVASIQLHPEYDDRTQNYDVAVIKFFLPARFNARIRPVCLPYSNTVDYTGKSLVVAGWGAVTEGKSEMLIMN